MIIDIPKRPVRHRATYARATVTVRHLLGGGYRVYYEGDLIAEAASPPPTEPEQGPRTELGRRKRQRQISEFKKRREGVTDSLTC